MNLIDNELVLIWYSYYLNSYYVIIITSLLFYFIILFCFSSISHFKKIFYYLVQLYYFALLFMNNWKKTCTFRTNFCDHNQNITDLHLSICFVDMSVYR